MYSKVFFLKLVSSINIIRDLINEFDPASLTLWSSIYVEQNYFFDYENSLFPYDRLEIERSKLNDLYSESLSEIDIVLLNIVIEYLDNYLKKLQIADKKLNVLKLIDQNILKMGFLEDNHKKNNILEATENMIYMLCNNTQLSKSDLKKIVCQTKILNKNFNLNFSPSFKNISIVEKAPKKTYRSIKKIDTIINNYYSKAKELVSIIDFDNKPESNLFNSNLEQIVNNKLRNIQNQTGMSSKFIWTPDFLNNIIPDAAYIPKEFIQSKNDLLVLNKRLKTSTSFSEEQLDLLLAHEMYPGHLYNFRIGLLGKFKDILDFIMDVKIFEGIAVYSELCLAKHDTKKMHFFQIQYLRRLIMGIYTLNYCNDLKHEENISCIFSYLNLKKTSSNFVSFITNTAFKVNWRNLEYLSGFDFIVNYEDSLEEIYKLGPVNEKVIVQYIKER